MSAILYPNVTSLPAPAGHSRHAKKHEAHKAEFDQAFESALQKQAPASEKAGDLSQDLAQVRSPLKFSAHASQRLADRKIHLDSATMAKVNEAVDKAAAKGIEDTLVLTKDAALIVSVKNRTVVTAMDKAAMNGNVFTNIDGAVII